MSAEQIRTGDVIQLSPEPGVTKNTMFAGCMAVVSEVKSWGVQCYVQSLGADGKIGGLAYYRAEEGTYEYVGVAAWVQP